MQKLSYGERLRILRKRAGYKTQKAFLARAASYKLHINARRYGDFERNRILLDIEDVYKICLITGASADELIFGAVPTLPHSLKGLTDGEMALMAYIAVGLKKRILD